MVRSAKTVLKSILGAQTVTDVVLRTLFTKVERILNGRAFTANSDDQNHLEPLTPAHLLMQRKIICLPPGVFEKTDIYRNKWRQVQFLANFFLGKVVEGVHPNPPTTRQIAKSAA